MGTLKRALRYCRSKLEKELINLKVVTTDNELGDDVAEIVHLISAIRKRHVTMGRLSGITVKQLGMIWGVSKCRVSQITGDFKDQSIKVPIKSKVIVGYGEPLPEYFKLWFTNSRSEHYEQLSDQTVNRILTLTTVKSFRTCLAELKMICSDSLCARTLTGENSALLAISQLKINSGIEAKDIRVLINAQNQLYKTIYGKSFDITGVYLFSLTLGRCTQDKVLLSWERVKYCHCQMMSVLMDRAH